MVLWLVVLIIVIYFGLSVAYLFVLTVAGKWWYKNPWTKDFEKPESYRRIAILVPAYKEDGIIMATAENLLEQDYPAICYDVHIIADSLKEKTVQDLKTLPLQVWEVSFRQSTKARSLNAFFGRNTQPYDLVLICDADNMLDSQFLQRVNRAFDLGARCVQGKRVAKNMDTSYSILDACSEAINNHIFRRGSNALGLSCSLVGSGMVFEYNMIRDVLSTIDSVTEDKPLQMKIISEGLSIQYLEDAVIYDEKIDSAQAFGRQRRRWLSGQFVCLAMYFFPGWIQLVKGNLSYFNLGVCTNMVPPRSLLLGFLPLIAIGAWWVDPTLGYVALGLWGLYLITLALALPRTYYRRGLGKALLQLPGAIGIMALNLLHIRSGQKNFIHTLHTRTGIHNQVPYRKHGS